MKHGFQRLVIAAAAVIAGATGALAQNETYEDTPGVIDAPGADRVQGILDAYNSGDAEAIAGAVGVVRRGGTPLGASVIAGSIAIAALVRFSYLLFDLAELDLDVAYPMWLMLGLLGLFGTLVMGIGIVLLKPIAGPVEPEETS